MMTEPPMTTERVSEILSHPKPPRTTVDGWRPSYLERAKLIKLADGFECPQAVVGDVVEVRRTVTPPTGFYGDEPGCIWIFHGGGSGCGGNMAILGHLSGTAGVWEKVEDRRLCLPDGSKLEWMTAADRIEALVAELLALKDEERAKILLRLAA